MTRRFSTIIAAAFVIIAIGVCSRGASAAALACAVTNVGINNSTPQPQLTIICSGTSSFANQGGPHPGGTCPAISLDVIKMWESLATSAFLAGKHLNIAFTPSSTNCSSNTIVDVELVN